MNVMMLIILVNKIYVAVHAYYDSDYFLLLNSFGAIYIIVVGMYQIRSDFKMRSKKVK